MKSKKIVAMLLAGGQGSRLGVLTSRIAKPAVPFGGKYRIIDFPLSNCANSDIDTVGVLTQYRPFELNSYIGNGQPWDLNRNHGGVFVLPPYSKGETGEWYSGTANAIYQNISFIDQFSPTYVLILSGDHIYKMDYAAMLKAHETRIADATIAVLPVPMEETNRFGIMNTDNSERILDFEEKPEHAKSNNASMGIYIFTWEVLRRYLVADEKNPNSHNDFGKDIIPAMLSNNQRLFAYSFKGYWRDVGTIESLWSANMDLLEDNPQLNLYEPSWKIYCRNLCMPPHYIGKSASIKHSIVTEGARIYGDVKKSVIFSGVVIEHGAEVVDSIIMPGAKILKNVKVNKAVIAENVIVGENSTIGEVTQDAEVQNSGITVLGEGTVVPPSTHLAAGMMIDASYKFD